MYVLSIVSDFLIFFTIRDVVTLTSPKVRTFVIWAQRLFGKSHKVGRHKEVRDHYRTFF